MHPELVVVELGQLAKGFAAQVTVVLWLRLIQLAFVRFERNPLDGDLLGRKFFICSHCQELSPTR